MAKKKPAPKPAAKPAAKPKPKPAAAKPAAARPAPAAKPAATPAPGQVIRTPASNGRTTLPAQIKAAPKAPPKKVIKPPGRFEMIGNRPSPAQPIDPRNIAAEGRNQSARDTGSVSEQLKDIYPQLARYQQGQINYLADGLNNAYTRQAVGQVNQSFGVADQMGNLANQTIGIGDATGANINALAPQVIGIGDQYMGDLRGQAFNANQQAEAAAGRMDPLAGQIMGIGDQYMGQIGGLGQMLGDQARQGFATSGPTEIEAEMYRQGQNELALGRSLSPEQMRDATQSARQGMAARGMATGQAALGAELLNRDRFASQRQAERRAFAATANNLREENVMARRAAAGNMATASGNLLDTAGRIGMAGRETASNIYDAAGRTRLAGTEIGGRLLDQAGRMGMAGRDLAGNLYQTGANTQMEGRRIGGGLMGDAARVRQSGAGMLADLDPYARAINPGMALGQAALSQGLGVIGNNMSGNRELIGNAASFNSNLQAGRFSDWMNAAGAGQAANIAGEAAINAANITGGATRAAGRQQMWGNIIGGAFQAF